MYKSFINTFNERTGEVEEEQLQEIMNEITGLREKLHQLFIKNKNVTKEVLLVSTILDQRINSYVELSNRENNY